jgi:hypothetical protein
MSNINQQTILGEVTVFSQKRVRGEGVVYQFIIDLK